MAIKTPSEISTKIAEIKAAMKKDDFHPVVDGTKLQEHIYYIRISALDYLRWVQNEDVTGEED